jgi:hypothetical protein
MGRFQPVDALEFHHLDPKAKEFAISHDGITRSWSKIQAELAKCVLLCANCHRETHTGLRSFGDDHPDRRVRRRPSSGPNLPDRSGTREQHHHHRGDRRLTLS